MTTLVVGPPAVTTSGVPQGLRLATRPDGQADLTVTLWLKRRPTALETEVAPLVAGGWLDLAVTGQPGVPLSLVVGGQVLGAAPAAGPASVQRLTTYLNAEDALSAVAALTGTPSTLLVVATGGDHQEGSTVELSQLASHGRLENAVSMLAPTPGATGLTPVPPRVDGSASRALPGGPIAMRLAPGVAYSMSVAADPGSIRPSSAALAASPAARAVLINPANRRWLVDDAVTALPVLSDGPDPAEQNLLSLPMLDPSDAADFADAVDPSIRWYAPDFQLVPPVASDDPSTASFLLTLTAQGGVLSSGGVNTGLSGHLRLRLQPTVPAATIAALGGQPGQPVATDNLSVTLRIPYRQQNSSAVLTQQFVATVTSQDDGTLLADIDLLDDWVRLAYATLSTPGFVGQSVQVAVAYTFRGYHRLPAAGITIASGGKISALPMLVENSLVVTDPSQPVDYPALAADGRSLILPDAVLQFSTEAAGRALPMMTRIGGGDGVPVLRPSHPVEIDPGLGNVLQRPRYVLQSMVHESDSDVLVPCDQFGGLYRQTTATDPIGVAIGCQDYLRLGTAPAHSYAEIIELRAPDSTYQVWRSLAQPGVFVIVPATYRVARCSPSQGPTRAYRPSLLVYAVINADSSDNPLQYTVTATLEPDLPLATRDLITDQLTAYTPAGIAPTLMLPTDPAIAATATFQWLIDPSVGTLEVVTMWNGFRVSIATTLSASMLLIAMVQNAGITGSARLSAPDGTVWQTTLLLDTDPCGPWDVGPVSVALPTDGTNTMMLTNHIERPLSVTQVGGRSAGSHWVFTPAALDLAAGGTGSLPIPPGATEVAVQTLTGGGRLTLQQISVFTEDVQTAVTFLSTINFANHGGVTALELSVRLPGALAAPAVAIDSGATVTVPVTLPIVDFAVSRTIEYQLTVTLADATAHDSGWKPWDLSAAGVVVSLVWTDLFPTLP